MGQIIEKKLLVDQYPSSKRSIKCVWDEYHGIHLFLYHQSQILKKIGQHSFKFAFF